MAADDEYIFTAHTDAKLRAWHIKSGELVKVLEGHTKKVLAVDVWGSVLVSGSRSDEDQVILWDVPTWERLVTLNDHRIGVWRVKLKSNTLVTAVREAIVYNIADAKRPMLLHRLKGPTDTINDIDFATRRVIAASFDNMIVSLKTLRSPIVVNSSCRSGISRLESRRRRYPVTLIG